MFQDSTHSIAAHYERLSKVEANPATQRGVPSPITMSLHFRDLLRAKANHLSDLVEARLWAFSSYDDYLERMRWTIQGQHANMLSRSLTPDHIEFIRQSQGSWKLAEHLSQGAVMALKKLIDEAKEFVRLYRDAEQVVGVAEAASILSALHEEADQLQDPDDRARWREILYWVEQNGLPKNVDHPLGWVRDAPWFNFKRGNVLSGILLGIYERHDMRVDAQDGLPGKSKFFQVMLLEACECRTDAEKRIVRAEFGTVVNLDGNVKTIDLVALGPSIAKGAEYQILVKVGGMVKYKTGNSIRDVEVSVKTIKPLPMEAGAPIRMTGEIIDRRPASSS